MMSDGLGRIMMGWSLEGNPYPVPPRGGRRVYRARGGNRRPQTAHFTDPALEYRPHLGHRSTGNAPRSRLTYSDMKVEGPALGPWT